MSNALGLVALDALPPLPDDPVNFERPPVSEVALAVQLADPVTDDTTTLGKFWPQIQEHYPQLEPQPMLPPMEEVFTGPDLRPIRFQIIEQPQATRYWFQTEDRTELVQVQPDRFAFNWRKEPANAEYPRYRALRERFFELYSTFVATSEGLQRAVVPTWCEVTYINPIEVESPEGWPDLASVLVRLQPTALAYDLKPEVTTLNESYVLRREGEPYGRLHITAVPAVRATDNRRIFMVTLVARGRSESPDTAGVIKFLDEGRDLIVNGFKDMTRPELHKEWGLQ